MPNRYWYGMAYRKFTDLIYRCIYICTSVCILVCMCVKFTYEFISRLNM